MADIRFQDGIYEPLSRAQLKNKYNIAKFNNNTDYVTKILEEREQ